jgi:hypothetical protein
VKNSTFVKDAGGKVPGLILYNGELVAVLDVFNGVGLSWYADQIQVCSTHSDKVKSF